MNFSLPYNIKCFEKNKQLFAKYFDFFSVNASFSPGMALQVGIRMFISFLEILVLCDIDQL